MYHAALWICLINKQEHKNEMERGCNKIRKLLELKGSSSPVRVWAAIQTQRHTPQMRSVPVVSLVDYIECFTVGTLAVPTGPTAH